MKLGGLRRSRNLDDRRGGGGRLAKAGGGLGVGTLIIFLLMLFFPNLREPLTGLLNQGGPGLDGAGGQAGGEPVEDGHNQFAGAVLGSAEDVWKDLLGAQYRDPTLVLFSGSAGTPCGPATASSGPFYCPADKTIYIDPAFYEVMAKRLRAAGDFAQAYVIAHEFAHFVQDLQGTIGTVEQARRRAGRGSPAANQQTVRLELQADCYSGIWAKQVDERYGALERGDLQEALTAADAIGDDALGMHDPAMYTHGTSAQRVAWFRRGWEARNIRECDTFRQNYNQL